MPPSKCSQLLGHQLDLAEIRDGVLQEKPKTGRPKPQRQAYSDLKSTSLSLSCFSALPFEEETIYEPFKKPWPQPWTLA